MPLIVPRLGSAFGSAVLKGAGLTSECTFLQHFQRSILSPPLLVSQFWALWLHQQGKNHQKASVPKYITSLHMSGKNLAGSRRATEGCRRSPGGSNLGVRCIRLRVYVGWRSSNRSYITSSVYQSHSWVSLTAGEVEGDPCRSRGHERGVGGVGRFWPVGFKLGMSFILAGQAFFRNVGPSFQT